jgi:hypothetical protein
MGRESDLSGAAWASFAAVIFAFFGVIIHVASVRAGVNDSRSRRSGDLMVFTGLIVTTVIAGLIFGERITWKAMDELDIDMALNTILPSNKQAIIATSDADVQDAIDKSNTLEKLLEEFKNFTSKMNKATNDTKPFYVKQIPNREENILKARIEAARSAITVYRKQEQSDYDTDPNYLRIGELDQELAEAEAELESFRGLVTNQYDQGALNPTTRILTRIDEIVEETKTALVSFSIDFPKFKQSAPSDPPAPAAPAGPSAPTGRTWNPFSRRRANQTPGGVLPGPGGQPVLPGPGGGGEAARLAAAAVAARLAGLAAAAAARLAGARLAGARLAATNAAEAARLAGLAAAAAAAEAARLAADDTATVEAKAEAARLATVAEEARLAAEADRVAAEAEAAEAEAEATAEAARAAAGGAANGEEANAGPVDGRVAAQVAAEAAAARAGQAAAAAARAGQAAARARRPIGDAIRRGMALLQTTPEAAAGLNSGSRLNIQLPEAAAGRGRIATNFGPAAP